MVNERYHEEQKKIGLVIVKQFIVATGLRIIPIQRERKMIFMKHQKLQQRCFVN